MKELGSVVTTSFDAAPAAIAMAVDGTEVKVPFAKVSV
jgi:hypothetical protein